MTWQRGRRGQRGQRQLSADSATATLLTMSSPFVTRSNGCQATKRRDLELLSMAAAGASKMAATGPASRMAAMAAVRGRVDEVRAEKADAAPKRTKRCDGGALNAKGICAKRRTRAERGENVFLLRA